jgi:predicted amidohydrolase YtcJ
MTRHSIFAALGIAALALLAACGGPRPADMVIMNGHVVTVDDAMPKAEAVAIAGDTIVAVGSMGDVRPYIGRHTQVIDAGGRLVIPAFIEGHGHFMGLGESKLELDLTRARTWSEIVDMVADAAAKAKPGAWIVGRGWHQDKWDHPPSPNQLNLPIHTSLSARTPDNPVFLTHASGHMSFVNARAMELAGITRETPDPSGGEIVRDSRGNATGLLLETAQGIARVPLNQWRNQRSRDEIRAERRRVVQLAGQEALSKGITTFHDAGEPFATIDLFKQMAADGNLPLRLYVMVGDNAVERMRDELPRYRMIGFGNNFLTVRAIKEYMDGALGSRGAWMLEPYDDDPSTSGLNTTSLDHIRRIADLAIQYDFQVATHAIGDRANREVLNLYQAAFEGAGIDGKARRWRIEHAQHITLQDQPRFAQLGVIAAMQAIHCTSDGPWVPQRIGDKRAREESYMWRNLIDSGAVVANGTDVPVEDTNPIPNFYAAVTRRMSNGKQFYPDQVMTREEALRSYTINNAFAAFEEDIKGSITPGKLADIDILSKDIMTIPVDEIPSARVDYTILGGKVVYRAEDQQAEAGT